MRINYTGARACARKLSAAADQCSQLNNDAAKLMSGLPACWQGASAAAFSAELVRWKRETNEIRKEMESLSSKIIRVAEEFEEAERRLELQAAAQAATSGASGGGHSSGSGREG